MPCHSLRFLLFDRQGIWASEHRSRLPIRRPTTDEKVECELLELLLDSKGFGLEAIKGSLFKSLDAKDAAMLLRIRAAGMSSPNHFAQARMMTLSIMIRQVRQGGLNTRAWHFCGSKPTDLLAHRSGGEANPRLRGKRPVYTLRHLRHPRSRKPGRRISWRTAPLSRAAA